MKNCFVYAEKQQLDSGYGGLLGKFNLFTAFIQQ